MTRRETRRTAPAARGTGGRTPADVLATQMTLATLARNNSDWPAYEQARDTAFRLALGGRIEDEVSRYQQIAGVLTGEASSGENAREQVQRRLAQAFSDGLDRRESPRELLIRMYHVPRAAVTATLVSELRGGDGEDAIRVLLSENDHLAGDVRGRFGDDPGRIVARFTKRDWERFVAELLAIEPGGGRLELTDAARAALRRALAALPAKP
jgi:hypothetical protein